MLNFYRFFWLLLAVILLCGNAVGQDLEDSLFKRDKNVSVKERPKPEYNTDGIRSGSFVYRPELTLGIEYDDNVFATSSNKVSDFIATAAPSLIIETDRPVHSLRLSADAETRQYLDEDSESHTNFGLSGEGRLDVRRGTFLNAGGGIRQFHEGRTAVGVVRNSEELIEVDQSRVFFGGSREFGRTRLQSSYTFQDTDFMDARDGIGQVLDQDFRDREDIEIEVRGDYAVSPDTAVFTRVRVFDQNYKETPLSLSRDQDGFVIEVGADFDLTEVMRGEIGVGYIDIGYDEATRDGFNSVNITGDIEWFATPLITVSADASRTVRPSGILNSPSTLETRIGAGVDYEWRRNIVLSAGASYSDVNFRDVDRDDKRVGFYAEASYLMNRSVAFTAGVYRNDLDSDGALAQSDFDKTQILFGVTLRR